MPLIASTECSRFQADAATRISVLVRERVISVPSKYAASRTDLQLSGWHRVAVLACKVSSQGLQTRDAKFVGWHAFMSAGGKISHLVAMTDDGQVTAVLRGRALHQLKDALTYSEQQLATQENYEPIYLHVSPAETDVLWLRSDREDNPGWIVPLSCADPPAAARQPFTAVRPLDLPLPRPRQPA